MNTIVPPGRKIETDDDNENVDDKMPFNRRVRLFISDVALGFAKFSVAIRETSVQQSFGSGCHL